MRTVMVLLFICLSACAKGPMDSAAASSESCTPYVSPYMVTYPDSVDRKSEVEDCGSSYKATALDQSGLSFEDTYLTIMLHDGTTHATYYTTFDGQ